LRIKRILLRQGRFKTALNYTRVLFALKASFAKLSPNCLKLSKFLLSINFACVFEGRLFYRGRLCDI
jgi:hypothetical protein